MSIFSTAAKALKQVTEGVINEKGTGYIMPEPNTQEKFLTPKEAAELSKKSHGAVVIPVDKEEICDHAFDGDERLTSISVPSSVKRIGRRAFANCINLRTVELADGVETIESKVFTGCTGLTTLTIPDSVRKLCGGMFHNLTGLQTPVYNKSGTILYFYPCTAESKVFTIPNNVEQINPEAFSENPYLEEVVLPHELKTLAYQSFLRCGIRRITISKATKRIERRAFSNCESLEKVIVLGEDTVIESGAFHGCPLKMEVVTSKPLRYDERLHWFGVDFLHVTYKTLPDGHHCSDELFRRYSEGRAEGNIRSMWERGNYFANLGEHEFYTYAANFWWYRAARKGFTPAKEWLEQWIKDHPGQRMPSVLEENVPDNVNEDNVLCRFLSFDVKRYYSVRSADENGVVVISSWCGEYASDEDGFGREEY